MVKRNVTQKQKKRLFLALGISGISLLFAGSIFAVVLMKVVPQKIGYKDVEFAGQNKKACDACHSASMVDKHHATKNAVSGDCSSCHKISKKGGRVGVSLERNCMKCHISSPHHKTKAALNKECTSCHDSPGVGAYTLKGPSYKPSKLTPTKDSCKNCHNQGTVDGIEVVSIKNAHHGISLKDCNICHDEKEKNSKDIRICGRCHNARAIHEVLPHVEKQNCIGCHGDSLAKKKPKGKSKR